MDVHTRVLIAVLFTNNVLFVFVGSRRTHRIRTATVSTYVFGADSQSVHFRLQNIGAIPEQFKAYLVFWIICVIENKPIS